jgi:hypothetical protein
MNWHYYQNWNQNLFTFQRSFIVQGCKICHNMNLMQYKKKQMWKSGLCSHVAYNEKQ